MRKGKFCRWVGMAVVYGAAALLAALGWLWHALPDEVSLEPGPALYLPRFAWVQPLRGKLPGNAGSRRLAAG